MSGAGAAGTFFQIFGIVCAIVATLGFVKSDDINIWIISNNVCRYLAACRDRDRIALFRFRHGEADRLVFETQRVRPQS
jgi:hypothetical protein